MTVWAPCIHLSLFHWMDLSVQYIYSLPCSCTVLFCTNFTIVSYLGVTCDWSSITQFSKTLSKITQDPWKLNIDFNPTFSKNVTTCHTAAMMLNWNSVRWGQLHGTLNNVVSEWNLISCRNQKFVPSTARLVKDPTVTATPKMATDHSCSYDHRLQHGHRYVVSWKGVNNAQIWYPFSSG